MNCFPQSEPCLWHAFGLSDGRLSSRPKNLKVSKDSAHFEYFVIMRSLHNVKEIVLLISYILYMC